MSFSVSMRQALALAAKAEEVGESFYRRLAGIVQDPQVRQICLFFADQEKEHKDTFNQIVKEANTQINRNFSVDIIRLMEQGIDKLKKTGFQSETFDFAGMDLKACLQLALDIEMETVVLYEQIRKEMGSAYDASLHAIIREEREHAESIQKTMKQLGS